MAAWFRIIVTLLVMGYVLSQARKPGRWFGRFFVRGMNRSHSALTDWGLQHVEVGPRFAVLDVGCGGGRTIQNLAAMASEGRVYGADFADGSVATSREVNADLITAGRVEIQKASVSKLPYDAAMFDLVTAVETHYYWPDLVSDLREVLRVVKPGGTAIVIAELYAHGALGGLYKLVMLPMGGKVFTADQHREVFVSAGFADVQVHEKPKHGWICVTGRKPA